MKFRKSKLVLIFTLLAFIFVSFQSIFAQHHAEDEYSDKGDFLPVYSNIKNPNYKDFDKLMQQEKILESFTKDLNSTLKLPIDVKVTLRDCGQPNAFYSPKDKTMTMCYEFMEMFFDLFTKMGYKTEEARAMMFGATIFFTYHELGHALIDVLELPAVGREEDAVDQLSTAILMDDLTEEGAVSALAGILIFKAMSENESPTKESFADEHSLSSVRFYNIACWMYGRSPQDFSSFITNGVLPKDRAVRCSDEYTKMSKAWEKLLKPWMK